MNECPLESFVKFTYTCILRLHLLHSFNVSALMFLCYPFLSQGKVLHEYFIELVPKQVVI